MTAELFTWGSLVSLLTLTLMEVVLGIDNIIFISIVSGKLPKEQQRKARVIGLALALLIRVALLFTITWIMGLTKPLFEIYGHEISANDLILIAGGLFLMGKSTTEIHDKLEGEVEDTKGNPIRISMTGAITQIVLLDVVFSFDSILTAIGIADKIAIMVTAIIISLVIMLIFAHKVSNFVNKHPSIKMLALSFLLMIGFMLVAEGLPDTLVPHMPKGYLYFAMAFSLAVELLNMRVRRKSPPVELKNQTINRAQRDIYVPDPEDDLN